MRSWRQVQPQVPWLTRAQVDVAPALEDCLSQEVQDSFSFLEDLGSSEPEWVGVEDGEGWPRQDQQEQPSPPGRKTPGMGYLEELLGVGPQVRRRCAGFGVLEPRGWTGHRVPSHDAVFTGGGVLCGAAPG